MASSAGKRAGQQFGNYRLLHLLAQDPFAEVYLGEHVYLKTKAAIKVVQVGLTGEELERFLADVRVMAHLRHPHIIRVLEFGVQAEQPFLVMDYTSTNSLRQLHPQDSPLPLAIIRDYVRQIAPALQYAHDEGLLHCNLRPETILLGPHKQLLLSYSSTSVLDQSAIPTHSLPTPDQGEARIVDYRAPEQLQGEPCAASDQYALAAMVYEWLGGQPSSPAVEQVVLKALATGPQLRFATVSAFAHALEEALRPAIEPIQLEPEGLWQQPARERSVPMIVALIALVAVVVGGSMLLFSRALFPSGPSSHVAATSTALPGLETVDARYAGMKPQDIYLLVTSTHPFINDPLNQQAGSTWKEKHSTASSCAFEGGAYHVVSDTVRQNCLSSINSLSNFAFQVQITIVKGAYGGIVFRTGRSGILQYYFVLDDTSSRYQFGVTSTSTYASPLAGGNSPVIKTVLNHPYLMTVIAVGSRFYLYINKQYITDVIDSSNTLSSGQIGLTAGSVSLATEAVFSDVEVWKL